MPLAVLMGIGHERLVNIFREGPKIKPENIVMIGARSVDPGERELIKEKGIKVFTMHEIDRDGMTTVMKEAIAYLKARNVDGVHYRWIWMDLIHFTHLELVRRYQVDYLSRKPSRNGNA